MKLQEIQYSYYKDKISPEDYDFLLSYDPKPPTYSRWLVETFIREKLSREYVYRNLQMLIDSLVSYDKAQKNRLLPPEYKDIFIFKSFSKFMNYVLVYADEWEEKIANKKAEKEMKVLYRDKTTILLQPLSHVLDRKYGTGTHWCTASGSPNWWNDYSSQGTLYIRRWFNPDGSLTPEAYQLYIPGEKATDKTVVECRDRNDDTISDIDDFFDSIPDEIVEPLKDQIEKAGGLNAFTQIEVSCWVDTIENALSIWFSYQLVRLGQNDIDTIDNGDDTTSSHVIVSLLGKNSKSNSFIDKVSEELVDFNIWNGQGIYVEYLTRNTPSGSETAAQYMWHQAERGDTDFYEIEQELQKLVGNQTYDYMVVKGNDGYTVDTTMSELLSSFHFSGEETEEKVDKDYAITYSSDYNYQSTSDWVSNPLQRKRDRQLDMKFGA
jgi:hypothetical protein